MKSNMWQDTLSVSCISKAICTAGGNGLDQILRLNIGVSETGRVADDASPACNVTKNGASATELCASALAAAIIVCVLCSLS